MGSGRLEGEGCVLAAETERVAQRDLEVRRLARRARDVVGVALGVDLLEAEGGRQRAAAQRLHAGQRLDGAGGAQSVADRALAGGDRWAVLTEDLPDGLGLDAIVERRAGAVRVDVADV